MTLVAVLGATGFVGRAVNRELSARGVEVRPITAPRLSGTGTPAQADALAEQLAGCRTVVNAAGLATATAGEQSVMEGANTHLPLLALRASVLAGARFVHVSSAAVQGRREPLDSSWELHPFSAYSRSKAAGEVAIRDSGLAGWTIYRPSGVHGADRDVTKSVALLARSRALRVPETAFPTPLTLVGNVASAVAHLTMAVTAPPAVVHHPYEGVTTHSVLAALGGVPPQTIPDRVARLALRATSPASRAPALSGHVRRVELLWFGQAQARSWLTHDGWSPPLTSSAWADLGKTLSPTARKADL